MSESKKVLPIWVVWDSEYPEDGSSFVEAESEEGARAAHPVGPDEAFGVTPLTLELLLARMDKMEAEHESAIAAVEAELEEANADIASLKYALLMTGGSGEQH